MLKSRPTILDDGVLSYDEQMEVAGMIWEEELRQDRRKRECHAFIAGVIVACVGVLLVCWGIRVVTGPGVCI